MHHCSHRSYATSALYHRKRVPGGFFAGFKCLSKPLPLFVYQVLALPDQLFSLIPEFPTFRGHVIFPFLGLLSNQLPCLFAALGREEQSRRCTNANADKKTSDPGCHIASSHIPPPHPEE
ncbi:hypothetical protein SBA2_670106 [Acidobacteriia bacterium SbA2]|nr:hypothetical protein SBA2_670106 [Acidobacteriia bacterium SbA2]